MSLLERYLRSRGDVVSLSQISEEWADIVEAESGIKAGGGYINPDTGEIGVLLEKEVTLPQALEIAKNISVKHTGGRKVMVAEDENGQYIVFGSNREVGE